MQITTAPAGTPRPRFVKQPGGRVLDTLTGTCIARVCVRTLDTETADQVSNLIIEALHSAYGPRDGAGQ